MKELRRIATRLTKARKAQSEALADMRAAVVRAVNDGHSPSAVAEAAGVSRVTVYDWTHPKTDRSVA